MYRYYQPNPNLGRSPDCSVRAICKALNTDWETAYSYLVELGRSMHRMPHEIKVIHKFLLTKGFKLIKLSKNSTVNEISKITKNSKLIICRCPNHVVCCMHGDIYDSFDSSNRKVDAYWQLKL